MWYVQAKHEYLPTKTEQDDDGHIVTGVPHIHDHFFERKKKKKDSSGLLYSLSKKTTFFEKRVSFILVCQSKSQRKGFHFFWKILLTFCTSHKIVP